MTKLGEGPRWRGPPAGAGTGRKHVSVKRLGAAGLGRRGWRGGRGAYCVGRGSYSRRAGGRGRDCEGRGGGGGPAGAFVRRAAAAVAGRGAADSGGTGRGGGPFPAVGQ